MNDKTGGAAQDERLVAARIKAHMSGLDQYIPAPPPFDGIEGRLRPGRASWSHGRASRTENRAGRLRRSFGALALAVVILAAALVLGPRIWLSSVGPAATGGPSLATVATRAPSPTAPANVVPTATPVVTAGPMSQKTILDSRTEQVWAVSWSPGGTKIAVTFGASGQSEHVRILGSDGTPIESATDGELAWIDDATYIWLDYGAGGTMGSALRSLAMSGAPRAPICPEPTPSPAASLAVAGE
jgi:hypothetical protein